MYEPPIDKIELAKALRYDRDQYEKGYDDCRKSFLLGKRGRWKFKPTNIAMAAVSTVVECSECGVRRDRLVGDVLNYCPNCGAYMVEEVNKNE